MKLPAPLKKNMLSAIKQNCIVGKGGKFEVQADLPEGTKIEAIVLVAEQDETAYLLSTEANRQHLMTALEELNDVESYVYVNPQTL